MLTLENTELKDINGGGKGWLYLIGGGILLIVGIIDGFINPKKCNK